MKKLTKKDVVLLGEGLQVKKYIKENFKSVKEFYNSYDFPLNYRTFVDYLSREKISSDSFKMAMVNALDISFSDITLSKEEQLKRIIENITSNVDLYREEADQYTFDEVIENAKKYGYNRSTALLYEAKAKYYYNMHRISHVADCYHMAARIMKAIDVNAMIKYYLDLVIIYFRENTLNNALDVIGMLDDYVTIYNKNLYNSILFKYYYWKGIMISGKNGLECRKLFKKALAYASTNVETAATIQNIGLSFYNEKSYNLAIMKYQDAYCLYDRDDVLRRSSVWNNIAMTNMAQGLLDKAMENVNKAINMISSDMNYRFYMKYYHTLTKLHLIKGNEKETIKYFEALEKCYDKELDKKILMCDIMEIINLTVMEENMKKIAEALMRIIRMDISEEFKNDLFRYLGIVYMKLEKGA